MFISRHLLRIMRLVMIVGLLFWDQKQISSGMIIKAQKLMLSESERRLPKPISLLFGSVINTNNGTRHLMLAMPPLLVNLLLLCMALIINMP